MSGHKKLLNLVAFSILMQNGEGVLDKSPSYVLEKFKRYVESGGEDCMSGLDGKNKLKFVTWVLKWMDEDTKAIFNKRLKEKADDKIQSVHSD